MTITALAQAGDNIVIASPACDLSRTIFKNRLPPFGITVRFVESGDVDYIRQAIDGNTKGVFVESISSTDLLVSDISTLAVVVHDAGVPLIVYLLQPLACMLIRTDKHVVITQPAREDSSSGPSIMAQTSS